MLSTSAIQDKTTAEWPTADWGTTEMKIEVIHKAVKIAVAIFCCMPAASTLAEDSFTVPETIVNVTIEPLRDGREMILTGAKIFFETAQSSYHVESQRERPELANRTQDVVILQSKLVRFGVHQLKFQSVEGAEIDLDTVQSRLKKNPLVLLLPSGASIHPQFAAALNPETVVAMRADSRRSPQRLVPRPNGG
ncbi:hypothetical protein RMSM_05095 [Rhodopirellula maiorica SM1]|uniref:Uncharacterized protein n=1 Tax=Rhodopirellula maiorica SM1 TaxID=1265738 RepID=M5RET8_9BACT|nr:hypothetical protein [Rhodopirellula maiorica]EMI17983.1 hypothetical protein RMSM_05095 [Rhodopirellula maiorica SM1]